MTIYTIYLDIASFVFLLIISWQFFSRRQFPSISNYCFAVIMILSLLSLLTDIFGSLSLLYLDNLPLWMPYTINILYFVIQICLPSATVFYFIALLGKSVNVSKRVMVLTLLPMVIMEIIFFVTLPLGGVFSISVESGYVRGPINSITFVSALFYLFLATVVCIIFRKKLSKSVLISYSILLILLVLSMVLQMIFPEVLFVGTGLAAAITIMYFVIQNPGNMLDPKTNVFLPNAFYIICETLLNRNVNIRLVAVKIHGMRHTTNLYGSKEAHRLKVRIFRYLSANPNCWVCGMDNNILMMLTDKEDAYLSFLGRIAECGQHLLNMDSCDSSVIHFTACYMQHGEILEKPEMFLDAVSRSFSEYEREHGPGHIFEIKTDLAESIRNEAKIEKYIRQLSDSGEGFILYYQPFYNCNTKHFDGAEALLRFDCPEYGILAPHNFLPVVGRCGLNSKLDRIVIEKVYKDIASGVFNELGFDKIHINLSGATFAGPRGKDTILQLTEKYNIDPHMICFEVTETIAYISERDFISLVRELKPMGFSFAMDDFGTGYSNITRLLKIPFDCIKLDRSLLMEAGTGYREIIALVRKLGSEIVAEGVETAEQAEFVISSEVDEIQGFYYARPDTPDKLYKLIKAD